MAYESITDFYEIPLCIALIHERVYNRDYIIELSLIGTHYRVNGIEEYNYVPTYRAELSMIANDTDNRGRKEYRVVRGIYKCNRVNKTDTFHKVIKWLMQYYFEIPTDNYTQKTYRLATRKQVIEILDMIERNKYL